MSASGTKLLVDTNVWLDVLLPQRTGHAPARELFDFAIQRDIPLLYAATSAKDVFFLTSGILKQEAHRRETLLSEACYKAIAQIAWQCLESMAEVGFAVGCDESDLWLARKHQSIHGDFEDDLIIAAALRADANFVVTRDKSFLAHCPVAALCPADMLAYLRSRDPALI